MEECTKSSHSVDDVLTWLEKAYVGRRIAEEGAKTNVNY